MKVNVLLFAAAKALTGRSEIEIDLGPTALPSVGALRIAIQAAHPELASLLAASAIAINHEFASDDACVKKDSEIALIPPVSGG